MLEEQRNRLEGIVSLESMKSEALQSPDKLIAMILAGDPAMRLSLRTELRRLVARIELDFKVKPEKITIDITFINDVKRTMEFREPIRFTKPLHPRRASRQNPS